MFDIFGVKCAIIYGNLIVHPTDQVLFEKLSFEVSEGQSLLVSGNGNIRKKKKNKKLGNLELVLLGGV